VDARGFTLIEAICVMAMTALLAALLMPLVPQGATPARLQAYALEIAAILKADRNAAIRSGAPVSTSMSAAARTVRSGSGHGEVSLPKDVAFDALLAKTCAGRPAGRSIDFFADGASCGGTVVLARQRVGFQIQVNWLTGGVDIVAVN